MTIRMHRPERGDKDWESAADWEARVKPVLEDTTLGRSAMRLADALGTAMRSREYLAVALIEFGLELVKANQFGEYKFGKPR